MTPTDRQIARDALYSRAYEAWVASLPPAERAQLAAQGIAAPDTSRRTSTRLGDPHVLTHTADPAPLPSDSEPQSTAASTGPSPADILASFCARIRAHPNPLVAFDAACFASGMMGVQGLSETDLAKRHGVTRAGFSKLVVQWSEIFGLPPSRGMRSKRARGVYRRAQLTRLEKQDERTAA